VTWSTAVREVDMRRQPRIPYQARVRLRAAGTADSIPGRLHDLSPLGAFIMAPDCQLFPVGSKVECRLVLDGERRTLAARVAWSRPPSAESPLSPGGAGVEFVDLTSEDRQLLERLVASQRAPRPVDVWFEGVDHPTRCHAVIEGDEVELSTRLPFMRLHSSVRVALGSGPAAQMRTGTLEAVTLEPNGDDGIPHLHLRLTMPTLDSVQGTIDVAAITPPPTKEPPPPAAPTAPVISDHLLPRVPAWITSGSGAIPRWAPPPSGRPSSSGASITADRPGGGPGKPWLRWLAHGWRAPILGALVGALLVSFVWSLLTLKPAPPPPARPGAHPVLLPVTPVPAGAP
jgi:hypothetical protein